MGFPTASVDVVHAPRYAGKSTYTFGKLIRLGVDTVIAHSEKPLRIVIQFGFAISLLAFLTGVYLILRLFLYGSPVQGWSSLMVSLYFIGGIIITILGVLGVYLGKTFAETKKRPLYIVSKMTFSKVLEHHGDE